MNSLTTLLSVRGLEKSYIQERPLFKPQPHPVQVLSDVTFEMSLKETVALVGGSGSGKSTIARILCNLLSTDSGTITWKNKPLSDLSAKERARQIQMIFQDPFASLNPKLSIGTQLSEAIQAAEPKATTTTIVERSKELLVSVGLSVDAVEHYPFQFSGGQRQRLAIARALALRPTLLIADEPLSALDVTIQAQVIELLKKLKETEHLTILFITHDFAVADCFADRILVLHNGRIVEQGPTEQVIHKPKHEETRRLLQAVPRISL